VNRAVEPLPPGDWWIVETEELGSTACPSRIFAYQAAEVCRGAPLRLKVLNVRAARPFDANDAIAIRQSQREIEECTMDKLKRSGALDAPIGTFRARKDVGRVMLIPK